MNNLQILQNAQRVLRIQHSSIPIVLTRLQSDSVVRDRPWDKSTRAVVHELPDVGSPAEMKSRHLPGVNPHSPMANEPQSNKNAVKGRLAGTHFDLSTQNWERNQNKDFRSQMRQWDIQQQVFKTSRLIKHQEYGTFESNRGNISGRPSPSNSTPISLHETSKTKSDHTQQSLKSAKQAAIKPPASSH
ncbi:unnamed protein product [Adineta steineri]|uniref:Uncharacterized protein n=1 Tax=Adineta steineri TaxID=433720 RepID=A0A814AKG4_9BILA|nr:unnamed protein product [Adineta steineri]CAF1056053.1 unnamed protein product [Adineta steineri]CAF1127379.1 unnamed protein product [Adineta steineri]